MPQISFYKTSNGPAGFFSDIRNWGRVYLKSDRSWFKKLVTEEDVKRYLSKNPSIPESERVVIIPRFLDFSFAYKSKVGEATYEFGDEKEKKDVYDLVYVVVL